MIELTAEMIAAAARAYAEEDGADWREISDLWRSRYRTMASAALSGALAVHTRWQLSHGVINAHAVVEDGRPYVNVMGFDLAADDADRLGTKLVNEARAAQEESAKWPGGGSR
jgi:hypothetical protein